MSEGIRWVGKWMWIFRFRITCEMPRFLDPEHLTAKTNNDGVTLMCQQTSWLYQYKLAISSVGYPVAPICLENTLHLPN